MIYFNRRGELFLASSGAMRTGWVLDTDGKWYFLNSSGAMQTGVVEVEGKTYLLAENGSMLSGTIVINGKNYTTDASGAIIGYKPFDQNITFTATTNNSTLNDEATLGIVGTRATSSTTGAAVTIADGKIAITSVSEGTATITIADDSNHEATIAVTVASNGTITIGTITKYVAVSDKTAIDTAIATAAVAKVDVVISADGTDVQTTSKWVTQEVSDALDAAIKVATNAKNTVTTEQDVTDAVAALNTAVETYGAAKVDGTKVN